MKPSHETYYCHSVMSPTTGNDMVPLAPTVALLVLFLITAPSSCWNGSLAPFSGVIDAAFRTEGFYI